MADRIRCIGLSGMVAVVSAASWPSCHRVASPPLQNGTPLSPTASLDGGPELPSVEVVKPTRQGMSRLLDVPATIEALEQVDLEAKVSGYVSELRVDIGDTVTAGSVLLVLDAPEMEQDLARAEAEHSSRVALLAAAESAGLQAKEAQVEQSRAAIEVARREAERRKVDLSMKEVVLRRRRELFEQGAITAEQLDEAQGMFDVARVEASIAEARISSAESDLKNAEANLAVARSQIEVARAQVELATAEVQRATTWLRYATLTAPFDGVITRRMIDRGALVRAATSGNAAMLLTIQQIDTVRVFIEVPESDLLYVNVGTPAQVRPFALVGGPLAGTISRLASSLNPSTRTMRAEIDLPNPEKRLLPGMYAQVRLDLDPHPDALTIPATALLTQGKEMFVLVIENEIAVKRTIRTGLDDGLRVEVLEGLQENEQVVTTGKSLISDGMRVRAVSKTDEAGSGRHR